MIQRKKPDVDIILDVLKETLALQPASSFVQSLLQQYIERGGLSKKQLQGLYDKAGKTGLVAQNKLATLEAIILKKHTKERSAPPAYSPLYSKDEATGKQIAEILQKYPEHKRVLFLRSKYENNEPLSPAEKTELNKFHRMILQKP